VWSNPTLIFYTCNSPVYRRLSPKHHLLSPKANNTAGWNAKIATLAVQMLELERDWGGGGGAGPGKKDGYTKATKK
jgi:hypothetical protein